MYINSATHPASVNVAASEVYVKRNGGVMYYTRSTRAVGLSEINSEFVNSDYEFSFHFVNRTGVDITVVTRDGVTTTVKSKPKVKKPVFSIFKIYTFKTDSMNEFNKFITSRSDDELTEECSMLREYMCSVEPEGRRIGQQKYSLAIEYEVSLTDLRYPSEIPIYHHQSDVMLSTQGILKAGEHPYDLNKSYISFPGSHTNYSEVLNDTEVINNIKYYTTDPTARSLYINLFGYIHEIKPILQKSIQYAINKRKNGCRTKKTGKIVEHEEGIHLLINSNTIVSEEHKEGIKRIVVPIEEVRTKLNIFETFEEAEKCLDATTLRQLSISELEYTIEKMRKENIILQHTNSQESNKLEYENLKLKTEELHHKQKLLVLEKERSFYKHRLEMESTNVKSKVDMLKVIPAVILSTLSLVTVLAKIKSNGK